MPSWRNTQWELETTRDDYASSWVEQCWRNTQWELETNYRQAVLFNYVYVGEIPNGNWKL